MMMTTIHEAPSDGISDVLTESLREKNDESIVRERHTMYALYCGAVLMGMVLMALYVYMFDSPSWYLYTVIAAGPLMVLAARPLREPVHSRYFYLPGLWLLSGLTFYAALHYDQPALGMYLVLPGVFLTMFFWYERALAACHLVALSALFFALPIVLDVPEAIRAAVITTPIFTSVLLILGYLGAHANRLGVERSRFESTISSLLVALQERDGHAAEAARHVVELSTRVAGNFGVGEAQLRLIQDAARLHDVGKIGIPNELLSKPATLTSDEWLVMRTHPEIGERIVATVPGFDDVALVVRHTHERWDGKGYPDALAAHDIPLASRIIFACDAYEAMITERPFRPAMSHEEACTELQRGAGTQFDPRVVEQLLNVLGAAADSGGTGESVALGRAVVAA